MYRYATPFCNKAFEDADPFYPNPALYSERFRQLLLDSTTTPPAKLMRPTQFQIARDTGTSSIVIHCKCECKSQYTVYVHFGMLQAPRIQCC
mmetsp:Transcript_15091/g.23384  ORF Transcript_15091/g.23384 Transcript_15091/m.23384 type:complete len:92 (-) Transcript_15091:216-491(-)